MHTENLKPYYERDTIEPLFAELERDKPNEEPEELLRTVFSEELVLVPRKNHLGTILHEPSVDEPSVSERPRKNRKVTLRYQL